MRNNISKSRELARFNIIYHLNDSLQDSINLGECYHHPQQEVVLFAKKWRVGHNLSHVTALTWLGMKLWRKKEPPSIVRVKARITFLSFFNSWKWVKSYGNSWKPFQFWTKSRHSSVVRELVKTKIFTLWRWNDLDRLESRNGDLRTDVQV